MAKKFLIEVPHEADTLACAKAVQTFLLMGSHFLTNAEWGCNDGVHSAWVIAEVADKAEALAIIPPPFRADARIVALNRFTLPQIERTLRRFETAGNPEGSSSA